ncbi:response regulator [Methylophaga sp.]|uniref:response regulator n=1 Tax=Methylophaga sp. TaxID=2024840 RepID=UPI003F6A0E31
MRRKILIIEDDEHTSHLLTEFVSGYSDVFHAVDGREGIQKFHSHKADVTLLDTHLPDLSGFDVFDQLQANEEELIIFITADEPSEYFIQSIKKGAKYFLRKTIEKAILDAVLERALDNKLREKHKLQLIHDAESRFKNRN